MNQPLANTWGGLNLDVKVHHGVAHEALDESAPRCEGALLQFEGALQFESALQFEGALQLESLN
jgi:hypothetical protein